MENSFSLPPEFIEVLEEAVLPEGGMEIAEVRGKRIVLAKHLGKIHAFDNTCPHLGGSLGRGILKNGEVICPLHHWTFELSTGKTVLGVPGEKVGVYETKAENGKIWLRYP